MSDFTFLKNPISNKWVILAPRRATRPDVSTGVEPACPFCPGREGNEEELYRIPVVSSPVDRTEEPKTDKPESENRQPKTDDRDDWLIRVIPNKFPFAPIHELIIHTQDHHKNFEDLSQDHVALILETYRNRYNLHKEKGQVYIFHNRGEAGGESLPHAHTQLTVIPFEIKMDIPRLDPFASEEIAPTPTVLVQDDMRDSVPDEIQQSSVESTHFYMFCPRTSQWPDEVWIAPKKRGRAFGEISDEEIADLAFILPRLIKIFDIRHNNEFPFNFYIYPGGDWYLRITPRLKKLGGFEIGTGIYINTQNPQETIDFIKTHFENPDEEKIRTEHQAEYHKTAT